MSTNLPYRERKKDADHSQSAQEPSSTPPPRRSRAAVNTTKTVQQYLGGRIPSSQTEGEHRRLRRQQAVEESLIHLPEFKSKPRYIGDDHECFKLDSVKKFCKDYDIEVDGNRWKNFKRLLTGCQDLPFIVLQNPTNAHIYEYDEMRKYILTEIGLTLEDVVVVDVCSLLSEDDMERISKDGPQRKSDAVERSYEMVEDILKVLEPSVLISCQCATLGTRERLSSDGRLVRTWEPAENMMARCLCSRESHAKRGMTKPIRIGSHYSMLVYAVHPRRLCFEKSMVPVLRGIFKDVFVPCMTWFKGDGDKGQATDIKKTEQSREIIGQPVIAVKEEKTGPPKSPKVVVTEVDEDAKELREQISALTIQEVV